MTDPMIVHTSSNIGQIVHVDVAVSHKPRGRGRRFDRLARGLARRMRLWIVHETKWEQAHPTHDAGRTGNASYGPPWMSDHALADFSFACTCHPNERYSRKRTWRERH